MQPRTTVQQEIKNLIAEYAAHLLLEYKKANDNQPIDTETLKSAEHIVELNVIEDDTKTLLIAKYGALTRIFTEFKQAATVGEFKDALSQLKKYKDLIRNKRDWKGYFVTTQGETFIQNLELLLSQTKPNIPFIQSSSAMSEPVVNSSASETQPLAPIPSMAPLPNEERNRPTASVAKTVASLPPASRQDKRKKKVQKNEYDKKPESSRTPSLFEQIINNTQQIFDKLKADPTTTSDKIVDTLTVEQLDKIELTLRDFVIKHTTATAAIKEKCFANGKIKEAYFGPLQENKTLIFSLVADAEFDKLNFADTNTAELFALLFTPPAVAFTTDSLARLIHKPHFVNQVNLVCEGNIELAVKLVEQLDATQLSKITKTNIQAVLAKSGVNKDKLAKKLYAAGCFDDVLQQDPELLVAVLGMSRAPAGAPVCAALFTSHIAWCETNLTQPQLATLANNGFEQAILSNWTLLQRLGKESYTTSQLTILLEAVLSDKLNPLFSAVESRLRDNLKHHLQNLVINYETNKQVLKQCFLNANVRNVLLDFLSSATLLATFLADAECLEIYFDPRNRASPLIRASFSYVVNHTPVAEIILVRKLINDPEFKDRKFTEAEIKTLLMHNDEAITEFVMQIKLALPVHVKDLEIIFKNAYFTRYVISPANMDEDKFLDLLIDTREEQVKYVDTLLCKPATEQLKRYVTDCKLNAKIISHIEEQKLRSALKDLEIKVEDSVSKKSAPQQTTAVTLHQEMESLKAVSDRFSYYFKIGKGRKVLPDGKKSIKVIKDQITEIPYLRLKHLVVAFLHIEAYDRKKCPPRTIYTAQGYNIFVKKSSAEKKQEKQPVLNYLGQFIIDECFKGKHWDLLAYFLNNKHLYTPKKGTPKSEVDRFLLTLDKHFFDSLTNKSSNEIFFEILSCDSIKPLGVIVAHDEKIKNLIKSRVRQLPLAQFLNVSHVVRQRLSNSNDTEDYFRAIQTLINTHTDTNAKELYEPSVVNLFVDAASVADPDKNTEGQKAVKHVLVGALKAGKVSIETVLSLNIYSDMFRKDGETLLQFITTAKQALSVFVHFTQFKVVEFTSEQLERLKALACHVKDAALRPVAIFNHPVIVEAMRKKEVAQPPLLDTAAEKTFARPNKALPATPKTKGAPAIEPAPPEAQSQPQPQAIEPATDTQPIVRQPIQITRAKAADLANREKALKTAMLLADNPELTNAEPSAVDPIETDASDNAAEQPKKMPPPKGPPGPPPPPKGKLAPKNTLQPVPKPAPKQQPATSSSTDLKTEIAKRQAELTEAKRRKEEEAKRLADNPELANATPSAAAPSSTPTQTNNRAGFFKLAINKKEDESGFSPELVTALKNILGGKISPNFRAKLVRVAKAAKDINDKDYKPALDNFLKVIKGLSISNNMEQASLVNALTHAMKRRNVTLTEKNDEENNMVTKLASSSEDDKIQEMKRKKFEEDYAILVQVIQKEYPSPPPAPEVKVEKTAPTTPTIVAEDKNNETQTPQAVVSAPVPEPMPKQELSSATTHIEATMPAAATRPKPNLQPSQSPTETGKSAAVAGKINIPYELTVALTKKIGKASLPQEFKDVYKSLKLATTDSEYDNALTAFNALISQQSPIPSPVPATAKVSTGKLAAQFSAFNKPQEEDVPGLIAKHCPKPKTELKPS